MRGKLLFEINMQADYDALAVAFELVNVRRPGRRTFRLTADRFRDLGDELARYVLGVDNDFDRRIAA